MPASLDETEAVFAAAKLFAAQARFINWAADVPFALCMPVFSLGYSFLMRI